jgi:glycine/D-amino acid oxidase-like deaminating enzyme
VTAGRVAGVETSRQPIAAPVVVDAAGGWVRHVAGLAGAQVPVAVVRHQLLITAPMAQVDPADPITRVVDAAVYLRPARSGLMFGGFEPGPLPVDPRHQPASFATDDVPLDLGVLRQLAAQITAEVPVASTAPVAEYRGGLFTMSPDGRQRAPCRTCPACGWPVGATAQGSPPPSPSARPWPRGSPAAPRHQA